MLIMLRAAGGFLSLSVLTQHEVLRRFIGIVTEKDGQSCPPDLQPVLRQMCALYGLWSLERHLATLYQGEVNVGSGDSRCGHVCCFVCLMCSLTVCTRCGGV